jgi:hypothetical protein
MRDGIWKITILTLRLEFRGELGEVILEGLTSKHGGSGCLFGTLHILLQAENSAGVTVNKVKNCSGFNTLFLAKKINLVKGESGHSNDVFGRK